MFSEEDQTEFKVGRAIEKYDVLIEGVAFDILFRDIDKDGTGFINKTELAKFIDTLFYNHWREGMKGAKKHCSGPLIAFCCVFCVILIIAISVMAKALGGDDGCGINEALNELGPFECSTSDECNGSRICSVDGYCWGISGCD